jgi:hypothetical protein
LGSEFHLAAKKMQYDGAKESDSQEDEMLADKMRMRIEQKAGEARPLSGLLVVNGARAKIDGKFEIDDSLDVECEIGGELNIEGTLTMRLGDEEREIGPGTFVCVPPGVVHTFSNPSDAPVRFLNFNSARQATATCLLCLRFPSRGAGTARNASVVRLLRRRTDEAPRQAA